MTKPMWDRKPFLEVFEDKSGGNLKTPQHEYLEEGSIPVVDQGKSVIGGFTNEPERACNVKPPVIVFGDHTRCFKYVDFPFAMGADGVKVLKPKVQADTKFLFYYLSALRLPEAGYDRHFKYLKRTEIILPPLLEQRRIAAILERGNALREKRRQAINKLDRLLQSVFLEMFGDPVTNPKGVPTKRIDQLGLVTTGNTPSRANPGFFGTAIEWIKSDNLNTPFHVVTHSEESLSEAGKKVARCVPAGSTLVTCIAGTPECIGNVGITDREVAFNQQINAITPGGETNCYFLYAQLTLAKRLVQRASTASMKGMVNKSSFSQIPLLAPDKRLQDEFGFWFERFLKLHQGQIDATKKSDDLFYSIQQRAFDGELFSSHGSLGGHFEPAITTP